RHETEKHSAPNPKTTSRSEFGVTEPKLEKPMSFAHLKSTRAHDAGEGRAFTGQVLNGNSLAKLARRLSAHCCGNGDRSGRCSYRDGITPSNINRLIKQIAGKNLSSLYVVFCQHPVDLFWRACSA